MVEEVYTGFLHKSPGQPALLKTFKSWKRRFFVLSKTGEDTYHLTYYTNEKRDKSLGEIDLSKINLMFTGLETHQMRDWIQKHFKCPPSSVLFLRVEDNTHKNSRDYFLIGENSDDVDGWYKALKTQTSVKRRHTFDTLEDSRFRSDLEKCPEPKVEDQSDDQYDYPRKFSEPPVPAERKISVNEDKDEKDGKQNESPEEKNEYMHMASVQKELGDVQQEADTACIQTNTSINGHEFSVCNGAVNQDTDDENKRDDVDGWYKALKTQTSDKRRHTFDAPDDSRFRSDLEKCPEPKVEDQSDDQYDYPRKFSEPPVPAARKISVNEDKDEKDGKQDESPEEKNEYMHMASVQKELGDVQQEADTACIQTNTSINGHEFSVCNGAVNQDTDDENKRMSTGEIRSLPCLLNFNGNCASTELNEVPLNNSEMHTHVEKEICVSQNSLKNSLILKQEEGKPCVSECRQIQDSRLFHKGDQILAFNDLLTDTVEEIQTYLRRLSKDKVKLTIRRFLGSQPLHSEPCTSN